MRQNQQLVGQKRFVGRKVFDHHFGKKIGIARNHVAADDLGQRLERLLEVLGMFPRVMGDLEGYENGELQANRSAIDIGTITANDTALLEEPYSAKAGRRRQVYLLGNLDIGRAGVLLERLENGQVEFIKFWHIRNSKSKMMLLSANMVSLTGINGKDTLLHIALSSCECIRRAAMTTISNATRPPLSAGLGAISALSVVLIWASWLISTRHSVGTSLSALDLSLLRYGVPALVLAPVWLRTGLWPKKTPKLPLILMVLGSGAPFFQVVGFGMKSTPASAAGVLLPGVMPLAVALIGIVLLGERPDRMRRLGMAAIFCGGVLLLLGSLSTGVLSWKSYVVLPIGATLWAVYTHAFRHSGLSAYEGGALICAWSTIINLALVPFLGTHLFDAPVSETGLQVLTQGILSGLLATILYGNAVRALGGTQAAAYTAVTPVAAALGGAVLLGEPLGALTIAATLVTGAGVLLSTGILSRRS